MMKRQNVHSAIDALTTIFYGHEDKELGLRPLSSTLKMVC